MTNYASVRENVAYLSSDFGESFASRHFTVEQLEQFGRFKRGKNKGRLRGAVRWKKVESGGWVKQGADSAGYVENRVGKILKIELCKAEYMQQLEPVLTKGEG